MLEKYIEELEKTELHTASNSGAKINIHFPVFGEMQEHCIRLNKNIKGYTHSEIDFDPETFQVPHITLLIGFLKSNSDYPKICLSLEKLSKEINKIKGSFSAPYIKDPKRNYIFIDVDQSKEIITIKKKIFNELSPYLNLVKWDILNEPPHISIGYVSSSIPQNILDADFSGVYTELDQINMSFSGKRGTCLGTLREFRLRK